MFRIMITAAASGSGKTAVTCGLLSLLEARGEKTCAFKCGPDYIDPMFHRSVLGVDSHNLDLFLAGETRTREIFQRYSQGATAVVCEGVMGYYDGLSGREAVASPWHLSTVLDLPALLVVRPKGSALTLAAVIRGLAEFRPTARIAGVILNDCSKGYFDRYGSLLEEESGIPVLGYLPHMEEADFESRHLGLMTAGEIDGLKERIDRIGATMEETVDIDRLLEIGRTEEETSPGESPAYAGGTVPIAVARDEAFCFTYAEGLDRLKDAGAELCFFSPLRDEHLPEGICGLYLPGGYPELYGQQLQDNQAMRRQIREEIAAGLPTIAECGGFLYLGKTLADGEGNRYAMAGVLPGEASGRGRLVRFGYARVRAERESMLFRPGEEIPVHEFHYWDTTAGGEDLEAVRASGGQSWDFGFATETMYAGFPHLYLGGEAKLAERFVVAAEKYRAMKR